MTDPQQQLSAEALEACALAAHRKAAGDPDGQLALLDRLRTRCASLPSGPALQRAILAFTRTEAICRMALGELNRAFELLLEAELSLIHI